jgi:hypothetical protein
MATVNAKTWRKKCEWCQEVRPMRRKQRFCCYECSNTARYRKVDPALIRRMADNSGAAAIRRFRERALRFVGVETDAVKIYQKAYLAGYQAGYNAGKRRRKPVTAVFENDIMEGRPI